VAQKDVSGDLVLLDACVEDIVVEERGRLRFEEEAPSITPSSSAGSGTTLSWKLACATGSCWQTSGSRSWLSECKGKRRRCPAARPVSGRSSFVL